MADSKGIERGEENITGIILGLEKSALEKWNSGDPSGYLDISAEDVSYFDPFLPRKLSGIAALEAYYAPLAGKVRVEKYEMFSPTVIASGGMAVLAFNLSSHEGNRIQDWNCTEVYRRGSDGAWKIVQTHWSFVRPGLE